MMIPHWKAVTLSHKNLNFATYTFQTEATDWHNAV